jgi:hypothetical protein
MQPRDDHAAVLLRAQDAEPHDPTKPAITAPAVDAQAHHPTAG